MRFEFDTETDDANRGKHGVSLSFGARALRTPITPLCEEDAEDSSKAIAGVEALVATESARADMAISAFEQLAQRLEELAEATRPSWWRWLRFGFAD